MPPQVEPEAAGGRQTDRRRIAALDSLRGIAILMVMLSHYLGAVLAPAPKLAFQLVAIGRGGVILFFLLSGYLIWRNLERQRTGVFIMRRLFKIMPSFWLNLACLTALDLAFFGQHHFSGTVYIANFAMISDIIHEPSVSGVYWTLLIEVKFYLFVALQYAVLQDRRLGWVVGGIIALAFGAFVLRGHGNELLSFFPVFYIGVYAHRAELADWRGSEIRRLGLVTLASAGGILLTLPDYPIASDIYLVIGTGLFLLFLWTGIGSRWLSFLGVTSYNNYLYHGTVGALVFQLFDRAGLPGAITLKVGAAFAAATAFAAMLHRVVEQPMVRLGREEEAVMFGSAGTEPVTVVGPTGLS